MKLENKVVWERGVLMLPQHLQQMERYQEALGAARMDALQPNAWGVLELQLDEHALRDKKVIKLDRFRGILSDGTPVAVDAPMVIEAMDPPAGGGARGIYLALPFEEPKVNNYPADPHGPHLRRYAVAPVELHDSATDEPRSDQVRLATPLVRLMDEGAPQLERCARIKIAEVRQGASGPVFDTTYVPPCIRVSASPVIRLRLEALRRLAEVRLGELLERRRFDTDGQVEWAAADITRYLRMSAINSLLPSLHYLEASADLPPSQVFLLLTQAVGQLATTSAAVDMRTPFPFDFYRLRESFEPVLRAAEQLLNEVGERQYLEVDLEYRQGLFVASLEDPRMHGLQRYVLAVLASEAPGRVIQDLETSAKLSSPDVVRSILMPNLPGTPIAAIADHEADPRRKLPTQINRQPGWLYFSVPAPGVEGGQWWDAVWAARQVGIWLPASYESARIKLLGVLG